VAVCPIGYAISHQKIAVRPAATVQRPIGCATSAAIRVRQAVVGRRLQAIPRKICRIGCARRIRRAHLHHRIPRRKICRIGCRNHRPHPMSRPFSRAHRSARPLRMCLIGCANLLHLLSNRPLRMCLIGCANLLHPLSNRPLRMCPIGYAMRRQLHRCHPAHLSRLRRKTTSAIRSTLRSSRQPTMRIWLISPIGCAIFPPMRSAV